MKLDFKQLGINIDEACRDMGRRRFVSYDPAPYINPEAEVYQYVVKPHHVLSQQGTKERTPEEKAEIGYITGRLVAAIQQKQIDITEGRENWIRIGLALEDEFGELGRGMFHEVSQYWTSGTDSYDYDVTDRTYDELTGSSRHEVHIGTFFYLCKRYRLDEAAKIDFEGINVDITA